MCACYVLAMFRREFQTEFDKALSKVRKRLEAAGGEGHTQLQQQQQQQQQRQVEHNAPTGDNVTNASVAPASTTTKENDADVSKQLTNGDTKQSCNSTQTPASDVTVPRVRSVAIPDVLLSELLIDMKDATAEVVIRHEAVESNVAIVLDRLEKLERFQSDFPVRMSFHWLIVLPNIYYLFYA